jgi:hypothetical protein
MIKKITKLSGKPDSSLPVGYWCEGYAPTNPIIGEPFTLKKPLRTPHMEPFDWFSTTTVLDFDGKIITTKNSKWEIS